MVLDPGKVLIVGASAAGLFTTESLQRHGFGGEVTIVGDEGPYDRPPLSKQVLKGDWEPERATLMPPARLAAINANIVTNKRAVALDRSRREVRFADGDAFGYDTLVIATGAQPRRLPGPDIPGLHVLRTIEDALALRQAIRESGRLTVIGAGFIGLEVAATARAFGAQVTVVEPVAQPLESRIGVHAARKLLDRHRIGGVTIRTGIGVSEVASGSDGWPALMLSDQAVLEGAPVCVGIGCTPGVAWLDGSGLELDNGVVCDEYCQAAPGIWAAGDVARWYHRGLGRHLRIEHRTNAQEQGDAVARNILGASAPFTPVPFFWTDQFDIKLQCAGLIPDDPADVGEIVEGNPECDSFVRAFHRDGVLVGVLGWNAARSMPGYRRELTFADPTAAASAADEHVIQRNSL